MRIVEAISDTNIGGAGVLLVSRLKHMRDTGDDICVIIPKGSELKRRLIDIKVRVVEIDACYDRSFEFSAIFKYMRIIKKIAPDVINCHGCLSCRIAALLCRVRGRVYTRHCVYPLKAWQKTFFGRMLCGAAQQILSHKMIAVAQAAKQNLCDMGVDEKYISVIINGVEGLSRYSEAERQEIRASLGMAQDSFVIGIFARLEECKGHRYLLSAMEILSERDGRYRALIVGQGSLERELKSLCKSRGLDKCVIFLGFVDNVERYFNVTDVNVNCSVGTETSSLALSEGMSLGIPCVVSDYGGNPYMVRDGSNGFVYPMGDTQALANFIERLANDRKLYEQMSDEAYKRFECELNVRKMSDEVYRLYMSLCSDVKCPGSSSQIRSRSKELRRQR